jgi:hypothetical protein
MNFAHTVAGGVYFYPWPKGWVIDGFSKALGKEITQYKKEVTDGG